MACDELRKRAAYLRSLTDVPIDENPELIALEMQLQQAEAMAQTNPTAFAPAVASLKEQIKTQQASLDKIDKDVAKLDAKPKPKVMIKSTVANTPTSTSM